MIDKLAYSSKLRYNSPCLKTFFAVSTLTICIVARSLVISMITLFIMGSLTVYNGKASGKYYRHIVIVPMLFLLLSTMAIIVNVSDEPLSTVFIFLFGKYISISKASLYEGANLILSSLGAIACTYFLSLNTTVIDLIYVLKVIRCPNLMIELFLLVYRFIFVILDMAIAITTAQKCRLGYKCFKISIQSMSNMLALVFVKALKKSSLLYDAMASRCYDGTIQVLNETHKASKKEIVGVVLFEMVLIGIALIQRRFYG